MAKTSNDKLTSEDVRSKWVTMTIDHDLRALLEKDAKENDRTFRAQVRRILREHYKKELSNG